MPYRPLLGPFVQVLPPGQQPKPAPKAQPAPAKRTTYSSGTMLGLCKKDHALTSRNSYLSTSGKRICTLCNLF